MHRVKIMGRQYALSGDEDVTTVAKVVNDLMESIAMSSNGGLDKEQVAVLAAVHLASILHSVEEGEGK